MWPFSLEGNIPNPCIWVSNVFASEIVVIKSLEIAQLSFSSDIFPSPTLAAWNLRTTWWIYIHTHACTCFTSLYFTSIPKSLQQLHDSEERVRWQMCWQSRARSRLLTWNLHQIAKKWTTFQAQADGMSYLSCERILFVLTLSFLSCTCWVEWFWKWETT